MTGTPTRRIPERTPLKTRLEYAAEGKPTPEFDLRAVAGFATLGMDLHMQRNVYGFRTLCKMLSAQMLRDGDPALQYEWDLDRSCYAATAWRIEQLFRVRDAATSGAVRDALAERAAHATSYLLSCLLPLQKGIDRERERIVERRRAQGVKDPENVVVRTDVRDFALLNSLILKYRLDGRDIVAIYRTALMRAPELFDAVTRLAATGLRAGELDVVGRLSALEREAERNCIGFEDGTMASYIEECHRNRQGRCLEDILRPIAVAPFALLWESGALLGYRRREDAGASGTELGRRLAAAKADADGDRAS